MQFTFVRWCMCALLAFIDAAACHGHQVQPEHQHQESVLTAGTNINGIPYSTRVHWMRRAIQALPELVSPCPSEAFGSTIVNHTDSTGLGELICIGANDIASGNPTLHGEVAAINNCTSVLADPNGPYNLSASEIQKAWQSLSLYTTAEPCPMCASAIAWGGFREVIYGTSSESLMVKGWPQIGIRTSEVLRKCRGFPKSTALIENVLANETDPYFSWQFNSSASCPKGCGRVDGRCGPEASLFRAVVINDVNFRECIVDLDGSILALRPDASLICIACEH